MIICHYEKIWLNECPSQFKPVVYRRSVDNIFVLFKSKEHLKPFVNYINSKHRNIKFTFETEDSNNFSFLHVKITKKKQTVCCFDFSQSHIQWRFYKLFLIPTR